MVAAITSCENELTENAKLSVAAETTDSVSTSGDTIYVKQGATVNFLLSGDPDVITFYSGEAGHVYKYRERTLVDAEDIDSSKLYFSMWYQYGSSVMTDSLVLMYVSDDFPGLSKDSFELDSVLVENYDWNYLIDPSEMPSIIHGSAAKATAYEVDMASHLSKEFTIAIRYKAKLNTYAQPKCYFVGMRLVNAMKDGTTTTLYAGSFGMTPLNMLCHHYLSDQASMTTNREYGSVTNSISGIWNLSGISSGNFFIQSSNKGTEKKYSWLVSDPILSNSCSPDVGVGIKNITEEISSYSYTYSTAGVYTVTFVGTNSNYKKTSTVVKNLTIKVIE